MKHIIFVDDDANLLRGLKRGLYPLRNEWQMTFCNTPQEVLEHIENNPVDVVVSDFRMPGMSGHQLLSQIQKEHPAIIRILLTGQPDKETYAESINICHYFLWKPLKIEILKPLLDRLHQLTTILTKENLVNTIHGMTTLPTLPDNFARLTSMLDQPDSDFKQLAEIIKNDVSLTMQILKMVNSAFIGLIRQINTLEEALQYLGINTLRGLVLAHTIYALPENISASMQVDIDQIWDHSILTARLAEGLVRDTEDPTLKAYAAIGGILHDVGRFVVMTNFPDKFNEIHDIMKSENINYQTAEEQVMGVNHGEIGAYLASLWGLPPQLIEAIYFHLAPDTLKFNNRYNITTAVWHANRISLGNLSQSKEEYQTLNSHRDLKATLEICCEKAQDDF